MNNGVILITGAAGFIGMHTVCAFLDAGWRVVGLDNLNDYYDVSLKKARLNHINTKKGDFTFVEADIACYLTLDDVFRRFNITHVINLAAQAGVRFSIENPHAYIHSNVTGFVNILETSKNYNVRDVIYASSSSVYGNTTKTPFSESENTLKPVSVYAATKCMNEMLASVYSHQYSMKLSGLRFFTVYGPWGRPDMAPMIFADAISNEKMIKLFNHGDHERDFTYIDDIIHGIFALFESSLRKDVGFDEVYNIGASKPINIRAFLSLLEKELNKNAIIEGAPMQMGDVKTTYACVRKLSEETGYTPKVSTESGVKAFISWYKSYHNLT